MMSTNSAIRVQQLTPLTIFVACPGDCVAERGIVGEVAQELESLANHRGYTLKVRDLTQVPPGMGRAQQVIFDHVPVETWDVLVGILWLRFGQKSGGTNAITGMVSESGTEEEFTSALQNAKSRGRPRIFVYRRIAGPPDISRLDIAQFNLVQKFFQEFGPGRAYEGLYKPYEAPENFRKVLRANLQELLIQNAGPAGEMPLPVAPADDQITPAIALAWRERLLAAYDVLKLHRISSAYDAGSVLRADRDRVHLHDVFIPQDICDVSAFVAERLPAPRDIAGADADELRLLGMQYHQELRRSKRHNVNRVLDASENNRIVLLGDPGAGKSSLLQHRATTWARDLASAGPLPLLLEMRQYAARVVRAREEQRPPPNLLAWAGELLGAAAGVAPVPEDVIGMRLCEGRMVLYCDALDEIFDPELRRATADQLVRFAVKMPAARIVVTSRPVGYPDDMLGPVGFGHWMVQDFDKRQIRDFLAHWLVAALPDYEDRINVTARMSSALEIKRIREMAGNPLLLTLMSILARTDELPRDRMRLYAKAAELLLYQWDTSRSLHPIGDFDFAYEQKHRVLRELAWRMQNAQLGLGGNLAPLEMVREVFDEELKTDIDRPGDRARGVSLLLETLRARDHVLCHLGGGHFAFVHRGFLEYFCADWLCEKVRRSPSTAERDLFEIFKSRALVTVWGEVLGLGILALAPEVADPIMAKIDPVLTRRGTIPRWLSDATLADERTRSRYPKTTASLCAKVTGEVRSRRTSSPLGSLLNELGHFGPKEETRSLLTDVVMTRPLRAKVRRIGILLLIKMWPDDRTRSILTTIAREEGARTGATAVVQLASQWRDETARSLLVELASRTGESRTTRTAITQLAMYWRDDTTRALLQSIADRNDRSSASLTASRQLMLRWPPEPPTA